MWLAASIWFRGEVRGLGNIPDSGPVLLVGNHSGGNLTPGHDRSSRWPSAPSSGSSARFYQLAHNLVLAMPTLGLAAQVRDRRRLAGERPQGARCRAPRCSSTRAATTRSTGPSWERNRVDFGGRKGFIRLALERDVPIVPVVSIGGQETALFLTRGRAPRPAAARRPPVPAEGAADLAGPALGPQRRRHARPHPAPGQDHDRDAAARSTCARSSAPIRTSRRSMTT